jgi:hypothetical protein
LLSEYHELLIGQEIVLFHLPEASLREFGANLFAVKRNSLGGPIGASGLKSIIARRPPGFSDADSRRK